MYLGKKLFTLAVCLVVLSSVAFADKSVFIISRHGTLSRAQAYHIDGDQVVLQGDIDISTYNPGIGAVGNAVWPEKNLMFVTYEGSPRIVWSSTKTLEKVGDFEAEASNLAGVVVDTNNALIYVMQRDAPHLLDLYTFDEPNNTLVLETSCALKSETSDPVSGIGLALDEPNGKLYVTCSDYLYTNRVYHYATSDLTGGGNVNAEGHIDIVVNTVEREAVGIAVDPVRRYMYTTAWAGESAYHNYLVRTRLDAPHTSIEQLITKNTAQYAGIGVAVDSDSGYIYVTTKANDFRVYSPNLGDPCDTETAGIFTPAGVAVGGWYKKPLFAIAKDDNDIDCVEPLISQAEHELLGTPYNWLYYNIAWDANGYADSNVIVVDYLPKEVNEPNLISDGGVYDSNEHTVTWTIGNVAANDSGEYQIRAGVNYWARAGGIFTNRVEIEGDEYLSWHITDTNVCCGWGTDIIYVDKDATGYNNGTNWDDAYTDLQDALASAQECGPDVTAIWVAAGTYKPIYDMGTDESYKDATFELPNDVGLFGHFGGVGTYEASTAQRNFADANNETILDGQIGALASEAVQRVITAQGVDASILDGFTITGPRSYYYSGCGAYLNSSALSIVNCRFMNSDAYGVYAEYYSYPDIHNCTFTDNTSAGIHASASQPDISYCLFDGNGAAYYGLDLTGGTVSNITDSSFKNHRFGGIGASNTSLYVERSVFENNTQNGINLSSSNLVARWTLFENNGQDAIKLSSYSNLDIGNCIVTKSGYHGVEGSYSNVAARRTLFENNRQHGIKLASYSDLDIGNCIVRKSGYYGIRLSQNSRTQITNNWIHNNGVDDYACYYGGAGIYFENQIGIPLVRNNTIFDNDTNGIESSEYGADPNVINCIIYGNDGNDLYRKNGDFDNVNYCNLQNSHAGTGNIIGSPGFKNPSDPNDLHIAETSQCKDAGDPNGNYHSETDIDGEGRIQYGCVDIGADEYYWPKADYDQNGIVNFFDFAVLAAAWDSEPGDDNYNEDCDLHDNNFIDYADLALFCDDWLWEKAWDDGWMMAMGGGGFRLEGMSLMQTTPALDSSETPSAKKADALMLSAIESFRKRPKRLAAKSQKFYDITPATTITAIQQALDAMKADPARIKEILNWLDEQWLTGNLPEHITEEQYLDLRTAIEASAK